MNDFSINPEVHVTYTTSLCCQLFFLLTGCKFFYDSLIITANKELESETVYGKMLKWDFEDFDDENDDGSKRIQKERYYGKDHLGEVRFGGVATKANNYCYLKEGNISRERLQEFSKEAFATKKVRTGLIPSDGLATTQKK